VEDGYVEGLTGEEVINDLLDQVAEKLRHDCHLRNSDAYTGGYEGTVEVHLKLRSLDTAVVNTKLIVGAPDSVALPAGEDAPAIEETEIEAKVEIPLEPRLNMVRERSGQDVPTLAKDESGKTIIQKRHYAKKPVASGRG
jgi:hypothetical protein